jgi:tRNA A-37 threonylcarbamoyl transferase component Bud32
VTDPHWQRVKAIFAEAMERPPHERAGWLDAACADDPSLRAEVVSLLDVGQDSGSLPRARAAVAAAARGLVASANAPPTESVLQRMLETALGLQYEIVRPLGQGGMGAVYLARERALERFVAIKVLRPELAEAGVGRERFRREARIAAQLSHPAIVPLHTFGEIGGLWYFVMGYVRGPSLAERLRLEGSMSFDDARRLLGELAEALECAHRSGVVHRDIKPANVLLDADSGRAVLADFGIAQLRESGDELTATGMAIGTPQYMSPEQVLGERTVDERSDIYSLGALGYRVLSGREPFDGQHATQVMRQRLVSDPPPLAPLVPPSAAPLAAVVMRCLARDPALRWQSARELRAALERAGGGEAAAPLRELPAFGAYAMLWAALMSVLALRASHSGDRLLLLLVALVVPLGFGLHAWNVGGGELPLRELARLSFRPSEWWGMWWPASLRRPSDLYMRLPRVARLVRIALSALIAGLPTAILLRGWNEESKFLPELVHPVFDVVIWGLIAGTALAIAVATGWARARGASVSETLRLLFGSTAPSMGWSSPRLSGMLRPRAGQVRVPRADDAADLARAIGETVAIAPASVAELARDAERVARDLAARIKANDVEIIALARHGGAGELDRLVAQLDALESAPGGDERDDLTSLVRRQLDVVQRMRVRCELLTAHRERMLELQRGIWRRLTLVRDVAPGNGELSSAQREHLDAVLAEARLVLEAPKE